MNNILDYDDALIKMCFSRLNIELCRYCGFYISEPDFNMNMREIIQCIESECPTLKRECDKRNPYYEAKKKVTNQAS